MCTFGSSMFSSGHTLGIFHGKLIINGCNGREEWNRVCFNILRCFSASGDMCPSVKSLPSADAPVWSPPDNDELDIRVKCRMAHCGSIFIGFIGVWGNIVWSSSCKNDQWSHITRCYDIFTMPNVTNHSLLTEMVQKSHCFKLSKLHPSVYVSLFRLRHY